MKTQTVTSSCFGAPTDLSIAQDGTLRLLWTSPCPGPEVAETWILNEMLERVSTVDLATTDAIQVLVVATRPSAEFFGRVFWQRMDGIAVYPMADDGLVRELLALYDPGQMWPTDYWVLPNGEGRLLLNSADGQTDLRFVDAEDLFTGDSIQCNHPGWTSTSYAIDDRGIVWASYRSGTDAKVCAFADESDVSCDLSKEGWGPGACRTYSAPQPSLMLSDLAVSR